MLLLNTIDNEIFWRVLGIHAATDFMLGKKQYIWCKFEKGPSHRRLQ